MAQFDIYLLRDGTHVVDVQSPLASVHATRLVIPLVDPDEDTSPLSRLNPRVLVDGQPWLLGIQFTSTVDAKLLKAPVGSLADEEWSIKGAIDFLINGF